MPERPLSDPLNKRTVTEGSILVLPAYPTVMTLLGLIFILQELISPGQRTSSPALAPAKWVLSWTPNPILTWGAIFLAVGVAKWAALLSERRRVFMHLLIVGCGLSACWAIMLLSSAITDSLVSFTGFVWVGFFSYCHFASIRSLSRDLVIK